MNKQKAPPTHCFESFVAALVAAAVAASVSVTGRPPRPRYTSDGGPIIKK